MDDFQLNRHLRITQSTTLSVCYLSLHNIPVKEICVNKITLLTLSTPVILLGACTRAVGPRAMVRDRAQYSESLNDSWKDQTLLNIVKLRYSDPPTFVDIGSIVASYTLQQSANVGGTIQSPNGSAVLGAAGSFSNSPTITYTPLTGAKFIQSLMTPLPPASVFFAIQSGFPADVILFASVSSINGLRNQETTFQGIIPADPDFHRVRHLMRKIQLSGAVRIYVKQDEKKETTSLMSFRTEEISPETLADIRELRRLLHLNPDAHEFKLVYAPISSSDAEVAVITRSVLSLMRTMSAQVEVPDEDLTAHRAFSGLEQAQGETKDLLRLIRIHSSKSRPPNAFVTVFYRGVYFWIDDSDLASKEMFSLMVLFFTLADTGERENLPLITIPAK